MAIDLDNERARSRSTVTRSTAPSLRSYLDACGVEGGLNGLDLCLHHRLGTGPPGFHQGVELLSRERLALGGALDFDQAAVAGEDQIEINIAVEVLAVVEIDKGFDRRPGRRKRLRPDG